MRRFVTASMPDKRVASYVVSLFRTETLRLGGLVYAFLSLSSVERSRTADKPIAP